MKKDYLGYPVYEVAELEGLELPEMEPNTCGVLVDAIRVQLYENKRDNVQIYIGKYKGQYFEGYHYNFSDHGGSCGVWAKATMLEGPYRPEGYETIAGAFNARLLKMRKNPCKELQKILSGIKPLPDRAANVKKIHNCMDCPLYIIRGRTKCGEVFYRRDCSEEMCDTMMNKPTNEDIDLYLLFHKEPKRIIMERIGYIGSYVKIADSTAAKWLENVNKIYPMAEAPKLW